MEDISTQNNEQYRGNTISLNLSAAAFAKLIDLQPEGSDQFILKLRRTAIDQVLAKRCKHLVDDAMQSEIDRRIREVLFKEQRYGYKPELKEEFQKTAKEALTELDPEFRIMINDITKERAREYCDTFIREKLDAYLAAAFGRYCDDYIRIQIRNRFDEAMTSMASKPLGI